VFKKITVSLTRVLLAIVTVATLALSGCSSKTDTWGAGNNSSQQNALQGSSMLKEKEGNQGTHDETNTSENNSLGNGTNTNANNASYENFAVVIYYPDDWKISYDDPAVAIVSPDQEYLIVVIEYPDLIFDEEGLDHFCPPVYEGFESNGWLYPKGHERMTINNTIVEKTSVEIPKSGYTETGYLLFCASPKGLAVIQCISYNINRYSPEIIDGIVGNMEFK